MDNANNEFAKSKFTAIISDVHLTEAEPEHPDKPLWKKYKTRRFFFDEQLSSFLEHIQREANGEKVELVLNGDIFDFDSVMAMPPDAPYSISQVEKKRGLFAEEPKSVFKIKVILKDHESFIKALGVFIKKGNRVVIVVGNHDLELHYPAVQKEIRKALDLSNDENTRLRFCEWFYISNGDTLIEHGNQYDPYCLCQNPINPLVQKFNRTEVRLPFGDLACRYLINGMGFFNPHVDSNYIMTFKEYINFFVKYMMRTQPLIMFSWLWGSFLTVVHSFTDRLLPDLKDPLTIEDRINEIAAKSNATPRMVRELKELAAHPATSYPLRMAQELWLDRAFMVLVSFLIIFWIFTLIKLQFSISFFWMFIPLAICVPFFVFYSKSIRSEVHRYKEPDEMILSISSKITRVKRVVYGHTHIPRHEIAGEIEHLNSGCWSPAFLDVECTKLFSKKLFVWLTPGEGDVRKAELREFTNGTSKQAYKARPFYTRKERKKLYPAKQTG